MAAAKGLSTMITAQHARESALLSHVEKLALGKDKLILRSIADRIEELAICIALHISRTTMRERGLFTLAKLKAAIGKDIETGPGTTCRITQTHYDLADGIVSSESSRYVTRGRGHIKRLGDIEAHEDPTPYMDTIEDIIEHVFGRDKAKIDDVNAVVNAYLHVLEQAKDDGIED